MEFYKELQLYKEDEVLSVDIDIKKNLKELLNNVKIIEYSGNLDVEVSGIQIDSRKIKDNEIFFAANGFVQKGSIYIPSAVEKGATVIVVEEDCDINEVKKELKKDVTIIKVNDVREAIGYISKDFYGDVTKDIPVIGVTGTKGKSTITFMVKNILENAGYTVCLIGSLGSYLGDKKLQNSSRTTPDSFEIQRIVYKARKLGADVVVMEVSSQALITKRTVGIDFDITAFTNFGKEHISKNEHPSLEAYFDAKTEIVKLAKNNILNIDDKNVVKVIDKLEGHNIITVGITNQNSDIKADESSIVVDSTKTSFIANVFGINQVINLKIQGYFSVYNALIAIGIAKMLGVDPFISAKGLESTVVEGRLEPVKNKLGLNILLDYAHTPDSLESVLKAVKSYSKGKVICAWGVGGNRDSSKRPVMGKISGELADYTILMSDQIRNEDPEKILQEIEVGTKEVTDNYEVYVDRKEGIKRAIELATKDDIVLIPGFGHDKYQEIQGVKYHFDERLIIGEIIDNMNY